MDHSTPELRVFLSIFVCAHGAIKDKFNDKVYTRPSPDSTNNSMLIFVKIIENAI